MIVHSKNFITNVDEKSIQPNAVDIRASALFVFNSHDTVLISESQSKQFASREPAQQVFDGATGISCWVIPPQSIVEFHTQHETTVPEGYAGTLQIRSTLARNGLIMTNGLYDSGYTGMVAGTLHNPGNRAIMLETNCRVGQYVMFKADTNHLYDGFYNDTKGHLEKQTDASTD